MAGLTIDNPVTLTQALASTRIIAGDILYLADGTYTGDYVVNTEINGSVDNPIIIKPRNIGKVKIDGSIVVAGTYINIYDIDFTNSKLNRVGADSGIYCSTVGFGLFGCTISNLRNSGVSWFGSGVGNICENLILLNGYRLEDGSGHGHGIYSHNNGGGLRTIARNIFFDQLGSYAFQIYSGGENYLKDYNVQQNIIHGDPAHTGGGLGLINFLYENNIQFSDYCQQGRYSPDGSNDNGIIRNNTFIDMNSYYVNPSWSNLTEENNIVYGGEPADRIGYTLTEKPANKTWFIPYTKSERWVGSIAVYNYAEADTVGIDLTGLVDAGSYKLRNGHNPVETWDFEYTTGSINIPMKTWTAASYIGDRDNTTTTPVFGAFVVEKT